MELLYIWIEDYKNIHHQGFNFSPEYQFEFKPTEVEDQKELSGTVQRVKSGILRNLKQNGTAIKDFFQPSEEVKTYWKEKRPDENLGTISNVTAVIGKNGSGKSNLLKFILDRIVPYIKNHLKDDPGKLGETPRDFLFIFRKAKKIYYFSWKLKVGMEAKEILELVTDPKMIENCVLCYYSSMISSTQKSFRNFHYGNGDTIHFVSLSDDSFLEGLSLDEYRRQDLRRHIEFVHLKREILLPFSILEAMYFFVNRDYEDELNEGTGNDLTNSLINFFKDFKTGYLSDYTIKKELEVINVFRIIKSIIIGDCKYLLEIESATWMRFFSDICNQGEINFENVNTFLKDQSESGKESFRKKIEEAQKNFSYFYSQINVFIEGENVPARKFLIKMPEIHKLFPYYLKLHFDFFDFEWAHPMSSGEEKLLNLYSRFFALKNISLNIPLKDFKKRDLLPRFSLDKFDSILLLIDEGEIGFHPEWQRQYLKYLIDFFPQIYPGKNIQIILTSHSPFLVSDLPKENIIFLQKGETKDGKCIVVNAMDKKHTFGGNIHTLFADSFFLENSTLMGEFAKGKIEEIIELLQKKDALSEEEKGKIESVIEIIGEPIIRRKLTEMHYEKTASTSLIDENEYLKQEIERLKRERNDTDKKE